MSDLRVAIEKSSLKTHAPTKPENVTDPAVQKDNSLKDFELGIYKGELLILAACLLSDVVG